MLIPVVERAKEAIDKVFNDTSVGLEVTLERMEDLRAEIEINIDALKQDMKRKVRL